MIQCSSLSKYFDGVPVLSDVTLTVESGSIYGLTGSNGAGKSTLMRIISGIYQQDGGTVTLGGEPVWENAACKEKVIFAADDPYFLPQATLEGMAHFSGRRLARPFLPDVPADRLKRSCSLVEPGLHPADLLELWVVTPRRNGDHS